MDSNDLIPDSALAESDTQSAPSPTDDVLPPSVFEDYKEEKPAKPRWKVSDDTKAPKEGFSPIEFAAHEVSGLGSSIISGWRGLSELVQGNGLDSAADAIREEQANRTYQPEEGTGTTKGLEAYQSGFNPLNWPGMAAHKAGDLTMSITNSPGLATGVETGLNAAGMLIGAKAPRVFPRGMPTTLAEAGTAARETAPELTATGAPRTLPAEAAAAPKEPISATVADTHRGGYWEPSESSNAPVFQEHAPVAEPASKLSANEQLKRQAILERVGVTETRNSAIEGDAQAASNEYQESRLNSANGSRMKEVLDNERAALSTYGEKLVKETGGTLGDAKDETVRSERGENIVAPLDSLKEYFDTATSALYKAADERAKGQPVTLNKFNEVLGDDSNLTNSDRVQLRSAMQSYLKKLGMASEDGSVAGNAQQAETIRKYLNENWSPANSRLVGKLKDALDEDVTSAAGDDIYKQARAIRSLRARTLDDPDGIANIMDASGPKNINRAVPTEKIADKLMSMPVAQLDHIVGTLKNLPPELQEAGNGAINEIRAHMASRIVGEGQSTSSLWNAKGVTTALKKNSARLKLVFTPDELAKFGDLNDAGNILKKDQSYPGAAVQEHNLVRSGAMGAIRGGATIAGEATGSMLGMPGAGSVVGGYVGNKIAGKFDQAQALRNVEKRIRKLSPQ